jgi:hypothetical protein
MVVPLPLGTPAPDTDPCAGLLLNDTRLSRLAHELARGIYPPEQIIAQYGLSMEVFNERVVHTPIFMAFYAEAHAIWQSSSNAKERVSAKAGVVFEEWLREANRLLHDHASPMAAKVDLGKFLGRIAGFEPKQGGPGEDGSPDKRVSVVINLGHARLHPKVITIEKDAASFEDAPVVRLPPPLPPGVTNLPGPPQSPPAGDPQMQGSSFGRGQPFDGSLDLAIPNRNW